MDCFVLDNKNTLSIDFHIFAEQQLVDDEGKDIEHCECCFFPAVKTHLCMGVCSDFLVCLPFVIVILYIFLLIPFFVCHLFSLLLFA